MRPCWKANDDLVFNRPDITGGKMYAANAFRLQSSVLATPVQLKRHSRFLT